MDMACGLQRGGAEVLRALSKFQSKDRPEYDSCDHLKEGEG